MSSHRHQEERASGDGGCLSLADMVVELYVLRRATCAREAAEGESKREISRQESCRIGFLTTSCKKRVPIPSRPIPSARPFSAGRQPARTKPSPSTGSVMHILTFFLPSFLPLLRKWASNVESACQERSIKTAQLAAALR